MYYEATDCDGNQAGDENTCKSGACTTCTEGPGLDSEDADCWKTDVVGQQKREHSDSTFFSEHNSCYEAGDTPTHTCSWHRGESIKDALDREHPRRIRMHGPYQDAGTSGRPQTCPAGREGNTEACAEAATMTGLVDAKSAQDVVATDAFCDVASNSCLTASRAPVSANHFSCPESASAAMSTTVPTTFQPVQSGAPPAAAKYAAASEDVCRATPAVGCTAPTGNVGAEEPVSTFTTEGTCTKPTSAQHMGAEMPASATMGCASPPENVDYEMPASATATVTCTAHPGSCGYLTEAAAATATVTCTAHPDSCGYLTEAAAATATVTCSAHPNSCGYLTEAAAATATAICTAHPDSCGYLTEAAAATATATVDCTAPAAGVHDESHDVHIKDATRSSDVLTAPSSSPVIGVQQPMPGAGEQRGRMISAPASQTGPSAPASQPHTSAEWMHSAVHESKPCLWGVPEVACSNIDGKKQQGSGHGHLLKARIQDQLPDGQELAHKPCTAGSRMTSTSTNVSQVCAGQCTGATASDGKSTSSISSSSPTVQAVGSSDDTKGVQACRDDCLLKLEDTSRVPEAGGFASPCCLVLGTQTKVDFFFLLEKGGDWHQQLAKGLRLTVTDGRHVCADVKLDASCVKLHPHLSILFVRAMLTVPTTPTILQACLMTNTLQWVPSHIPTDISGSVLCSLPLMVTSLVMRPEFCRLYGSMLALEAGDTTPVSAAGNTRHVPAAGNTRPVPAVGNTMPVPAAGNARPTPTASNTGPACAASDGRQIPPDGPAVLCTPSQVSKVWAAHFGPFVQDVHLAMSFSQPGLHQGQVLVQNPRSALMPAATTSTQQTEQQSSLRTALMPTANTSTRQTEQQSSPPSQHFASTTIAVCVPPKGSIQHTTGIASTWPNVAAAPLASGSTSTPCVHPTHLSLQVIAAAAPQKETITLVQQPVVSRAQHSVNSPVQLPAECARVGDSSASHQLGMASVDNGNNPSSRQPDASHIKDDSSTLALQPEMAHTMHFNTTSSRQSAASQTSDDSSALALQPDMAHIVHFNITTSQQSAASQISDNSSTSALQPEMAHITNFNTTCSRQSAASQTSNNSSTLAFQPDMVHIVHFDATSSQQSAASQVRDSSSTSALQPDMAHITPFNTTSSRQSAASQIRDDGFASALQSGRAHIFHTTSAVQAQGTEQQHSSAAQAQGTDQQTSCAVQPCVAVQLSAAAQCEEVNLCGAVSLQPQVCDQRHLSEEQSRVATDQNRAVKQHADTDQVTGSTIVLNIASQQDRSCERAAVIGPGTGPDLQRRIAGLEGNSYVQTGADAEDTGPASLPGAPGRLHGSSSRLPNVLISRVARYAELHRLWLVRNMVLGMELPIGRAFLLNREGRLASARLHARRQSLGNMLIDWGTVDSGWWDADVRVCAGAHGQGRLHRDVLPRDSNAQAGALGQGRLHNGTPLLSDRNAHSRAHGQGRPQICNVVSRDSSVSAGAHGQGWPCTGTISTNERVTMRHGADSQLHRQDSAQTDSNLFVSRRDEAVSAGGVRDALRMDRHPDAFTLGAELGTRDPRAAVHAGGNPVSCEHGSGCATGALHDVRRERVSNVEDSDVEHCEGRGGRERLHSGEREVHCEGRATPGCGSNKQESSWCASSWNAEPNILESSYRDPGMDEGFTGLVDTAHQDQQTTKGSPAHSCITSVEWRVGWRMRSEGNADGMDRGERGVVESTQLGGGVLATATLSHPYRAQEQTGLLRTDTERFGVNCEGHSREPTVAASGVKHDQSVSGDAAEMNEYVIGSTTDEHGNGMGPYFRLVRNEDHEQALSSSGTEHEQLPRRTGGHGASRCADEAEPSSPSVMRERERLHSVMKQQLGSKKLLPQISRDARELVITSSSALKQQPLLEAALRWAAGDAERKEGCTSGGASIKVSTSSSVPKQVLLLTPPPRVEQLGVTPNQFRTEEVGDFRDPGQSSSATCCNQPKDTSCSPPLNAISTQPCSSKTGNNGFDKSMDEVTKLDDFKAAIATEEGRNKPRGQWEHCMFQHDKDQGPVVKGLWNISDAHTHQAGPVIRHDGAAQRELSSNDDCAVQQALIMRDDSAALQGLTVSDDDCAVQQGLIMRDDSAALRGLTVGDDDCVRSGQAAPQQLTNTDADWAVLGNLIMSNESRAQRENHILGIDEMDSRLTKHAADTGSAGSIITDVYEKDRLTDSPSNDSNMCEAMSGACASHMGTAGLTSEECEMLRPTRIGAEEWSTQHEEQQAVVCYQHQQHTQQATQQGAQQCTQHVSGGHSNHGGRLQQLLLRAAASVILWLDTLLRAGLGWHTGFHQSAQHAWTSAVCTWHGHGFRQDMESCFVLLQELKLRNSDGLVAGMLLPLLILHLVYGLGLRGPDPGWLVMLGFLCSAIISARTTRGTLRERQVQIERLLVWHFVLVASCLVGAGPRWNLVKHGLRMGPAERRFEGAGASGSCMDAQLALSTNATASVMVMAQVVVMRPLIFQVPYIVQLRLTVLDSLLVWVLAPWIAAAPIQLYQACLACGGATILSFAAELIARFQWLSGHESATCKRCSAE